MVYFSVKLLFIAICLSLVQTQTPRPLTPTDIITHKRFYDSDYAIALKAFFKGMGWPGKYQNSETCRETFSKCMDDFHYMYKNHSAAGTTKADDEGRFFNITQLISKNYADTFFYCFTFLSESHEYAVSQYASFVDDDDIYISFLFNMLGQSIHIRTYSYDLIDFGANQPKEDFEKYTTALAGIFSKLIYFESTAAMPLEQEVGSHNKDQVLYRDRNGNSYTVQEFTHIKKQLSDILHSEYAPYLRKIFDDFRMLGLKWDVKMKRYFGFHADPNGHLPQVQQTSDTDETKTSATGLIERDPDPMDFPMTFFMISFGLLDGCLNALPVGANLYYCGKDSGNQRTALLDMFEYYEQRDLTSAVSEGYKSLRYVYSVTFNCYYGAQEYITGTGLEKLYKEYDVLKNLLFNGGYMWTDIVMVLVGKNGQTESNYYYYLAFYVGDFLFRWIFRESYEGNCWYSWVVCASETQVYIDTTAATP